MTKTEILRQIEELKKQIEALPDETEEKIRTLPKAGDRYTFINEDLLYSDEKYYPDLFDVYKAKENSSIGNYFKSEEDAQKVIKAMRIEQSIRVRRIELNNGWEPDWDDVSDDKYFIYTKDGCLYTDFAIALNYCLIFGYYKSEEIAKQIIYEFKGNLLWYFNEYYLNRDKMYIWGEGE